MMTEPHFPAGLILATPGALKALEEAEQDAGQFLARHLRGDWGDLCPEDVAENEFSLHRGLRLMSAYTLVTGRKLWIITEQIEAPPLCFYQRSIDYLLAPSMWL